jgi:hypothetical protein
VVVSITPAVQGMRGVQIHDILIPGMGTGVGQMEPEDSASQMRLAIDHERPLRTD